MLLKSQFLEKSDTIMQNFQNFATKEFTGTWIHVGLFLPSFGKIGKPEATKRVRRIHHEKSCYFAPVSATSGAISPEILQDHSFPIPHPSAKFCSN